MSIGHSDGCEESRHGLRELIEAKADFPLTLIDPFAPNNAGHQFSRRGMVCENHLRPKSRNLHTPDAHATAREIGHLAKVALKEFEWQTSMSSWILDLMHFGYTSSGHEQFIGNRQALDKSIPISDENWIAFTNA